MVVDDRMKIKGKKAQVQITLTPESVNKARRLGLNISRIAQNALDEAITRIQTPVPQTETNGGYTDTRSVSPQLDWCGRRDLNPGYRLGKPKS